jgi:hypothetical protein
MENGSPIEEPYGHLGDSGIDHCVVGPPSLHHEDAIGGTPTKSANGRRQIGAARQTASIASASRAVLRKKFCSK